jgi:uncharacterized integral membrane protein
MTDHSDSNQHDLARDVGRTIRFVVVGVLIAVLVLIALDNTDEVRLGYVFGHATAPIWLAIAAAAVAGALIGWMATHRPRR